MVEIYANLYVGNQEDYEYEVRLKDGWAIVHACKEPYHRSLLGYTGRGAPKEHPEYLVARRGNRLFLNIVDVDSPDNIPKEIIDAALSFIDDALSSGKKCLVHCNLGESRSPSIGLLYLASKCVLPNTFADAESEFRALYPVYNPKAGIRGFIIGYWKRYVK
jgi:predicted protein tyrosine phosphatase